MKLDICIPAYNEEAIIVETSQAVKDALTALSLENRIVVASNGSTDRTVSRAREAGFEVMMVPLRGKGAAVVAAAKASTAELFGFIDADLSADPADIEKLLSRIVNGECDVAIGSRLLDTRSVERQILRTFSSRVFNALRRLLLGIAVEDTQCGLKLMNEKGRRVLAQCKEEGWFFDMEFLARCEKEGLCIQEVPIRWREHYYPGRTSHLRMIRDGFGALLALWRIRKTLRTRS